MVDIFLEESVSPTDSIRAGKKYKRTLILSRMFLFTAILFIFLLFMVFNAPLAEGIPLSAYFLGYILPPLVLCVLFFALYIFFRMKKHNYLVDYDYTFVSGELRIAKVLNGIKRKPVAKINCGDISVLGKMNSDKYLRYKTMPGIKIITATPNTETDSDNIYFMLCTYNSFKTVLLFQPSANMLYNIKKFAGRTVEYL